MIVIFIAFKKKGNGCFDSLGSAFISVKNFLNATCGKYEFDQLYNV